MDLWLLAGYIAIWLGVKSRFLAACFLAFLSVNVIQSTYPENFTQNQEVIAYLFYSSIYTVLSYYLYKNDVLIPSIAALCMAFYDLTYAVDTYANYDVQTWIWSNHEIFIVVLHVALMCVFIQKFNTTLAAIWHNSFRILNIMLHGEPSGHCAKRAQGKEGIQ